MVCAIHGFDVWGGTFFTPTSVFAKTKQKELQFRHKIFQLSTHIKKFKIGNCLHLDIAEPPPKKKKKAMNNVILQSVSKQRSTVIMMCTQL